MGHMALISYMSHFCMPKLWAKFSLYDRSKNTLEIVCILNKICQYLHRISQNMRQIMQN